MTPRRSMKKQRRAERLASAMSAALTIIVIASIAGLYIAVWQRWSVTVIDDHPAQSQCKRLSPFYVDCSIPAV